MALRTTMNLFLSRLAPWLTLIIGAIALFLGGRNLWRAAASPAWPSVRGVIEESKVESRASTTSEEGANPTTYQARIRFRYTVNGRTFTGTRVAYGDHGSSDISQAQAVVNQYKRGMTVTVFYLEGSPGICVLESGVQPQTWSIFLFGVVFLVVGSLWMRGLAKGRLEAKQVAAN
jgi:hypothetical protein